MPTVTAFSSLEERIIDLKARLEGHEQQVEELEQRKEKPVWAPEFVKRITRLVQATR